MKKNQINAVIKVIIQFCKFGIVGLSNTIISLVVYYILIYLNVNYIVANTTGFLISVLNAYYWNGKYIFKANNKKNKNSLIKIYLSYGVTFLLNTFLLYFMVNQLGISNYFAPIINVIIITPINFLLNKLWVFQ